MKRRRDVQPSLFFSEHEHAAGGVDQVGEEVLADLHGGREGHVAEQEDAEDDARDGLGDVGESRGRRLTLGVLEPAPQTFSVAVGVLEYLTESGVDICLSFVSFVWFMESGRMLDRVRAGSMGV